MPLMENWQAESHTKPFGEKQGALCVAIHLPTKTFPPSAMAGFLLMPTYVGVEGYPKIPQMGDA